MGEVYAGTVVSGTVSVGDRLLLGPTGPDGAFLRTAIASVHVARLAVRCASAGQTASFTLVADPDPTVPAAAAAAASSSFAAGDGNEVDDDTDAEDIPAGRGRESVGRSDGIAALRPMGCEKLVANERGQGAQAATVTVAAEATKIGGDGGNSASTHGDGRGGPSGESCGDEGLRVACGGGGTSPLLSASMASKSLAMTRAVIAEATESHDGRGISHQSSAAAAAAAVTTHGGGVVDHLDRIDGSRHRQHVVEGCDTNTKIDVAEEAGPTPEDGAMMSPLLPQLLVPRSPDFGGEREGVGAGVTSPLVLDASGGESPGMRTRKGMVLIEVREERGWIFLTLEERG